MKNIAKIILVLIFSTCLIINAKAETLKGSSTCYNFNHTTGAYTGSGTNDCVKTIEGAQAYCVEGKKEIKTRTYTIDGSWSETSREAIIAGLIIDKVLAKYQGVEAYAMSFSVLNTHFSMVRNNAGSYNFYNNNTTIKKIYDEAVQEYSNYSVTTSLPSIQTSKNQAFNNYIGNNTYISDKITISGLQTTFGGSSDEVTYTITADKGAKICTNASGIESSCSTSKTIKGQTTYNFYVKVSDISPSSVVRVNIIGNNQSTYPSSRIYTGGNSSQKMMTRISTTLHRSTSTSIQLTVPNLTNHTIQARKVNEQGELITGSVLEIYQDTPYEGKKLASGTSESVITYTSPTVSAQDDDFFNHDYYLVEKLAPNGYLLKNEVVKIEVNNIDNTNICYYNESENTEDSQVVDNERCNFENYKNVCLGSDGSIEELTENNDCVFEIPEEEIPEEEIPEEETSNKENSEITESPTEDEEQEDETPKVTYEKACYKISTEKIEKDNTYCDNKGDYIKVEKTSGNIVITHPNEKNKLLVSKRGINKDTELSGAKLKVCTKSDYEANKEDCEATSTIENIKMEWTSGYKIKEYQGIPKGEYYIVETVAPKGYVKSSIVTSFTVDATGNIDSDELEDDTIIIKNKLSSLSISKQDMTTSKELKGATLSICISYLDKNNVIQMEKNQYTGECIPAILADGTKATWTSTDEPKKIEGLASGAYFLVENIAPKNYSTSESILFIVAEDGTVLDKDEKPIPDNKIIMKDMLISNPKTGELPIIIISLIGLLGLSTGIIYYYKINKKNNKKISKK